MSEAPSWLTEETSAPGGANEELEMSSAVTKSEPAPAPTNNSVSSTDGDDAELAGIILTMRLANMGVSVALVACSIILLITIPPPTTFILCIYATCGGLLVCCLETQLKFLRVIIAVNFGFLFHSFWRFLFYLLLSSVALSYESLFGFIVAIALVVVAFFNTYVLCMFPSYRRMREQIAEEEDKRIEARISKEVKRQAIARATQS